VLTFDQIKELIELVADRGLDGVELERSGFKVKVEGRRLEVAASPQPAPVAVADSTVATPVASSEALPEEPEVAAGGSAEVVTSPIVGTFYTAPNPDSPPYVRVGDRIEVGQVLCIVEAMKLMNEIESDAAGVVVEIFPKNAQPVEFGEALFAIQAD
jgi:acetyl-CoA carboxylase biotin carboxyl carrier protein